MSAIRVDVDVDVISWHRWSRSSTDVPPVWGRVAPDTGTVSISQRASIDDEDLIDRALFDTLATGGEVFVTDVATLGTVTGVAATSRY